jgi:DNA topoisomerase-2
MKNNKNISKFEVLTGREQIRRRPQMWIGSMDPITRSMFTVNDECIEYKDITFIPAFRKICDEILDNALDALIQHKDSNGNIKVKMDDDHVYIEDDGPGIPVVKKQLTESELKSLPKEESEKLSNSYIPEIAWTRLFSGSNFQDSDNKTTIGAHGLGSKCTSIFSTKFIGKTDDGKKQCIVKAINGLEKSTCKVDKSSGKTGTIVEFWPELPIFKMSKIKQVYHDLMYQRLFCLAITFPNIKFSFNGKRINVNDKKFLKMFSENIEFATFENGFIGIYPNISDEFNFFTYVNGMHMSRGGSHIDYIINQITNPIREKLCKKYKTLKPADIKNKFTAVVFMRNFANPKFDSQTKETLTNLPSDVSAYFANEVNFQDLAKKILKNNAIINPIIETFKIKEELKARQELKSVKKVKVKSDKYMSPVGSQCNLFLCEGASAQSSLCSCLGREGNGFYALRGLPINTLDNSIQKIAANQEFKDVMNLLGLDITKDNINQNMLFERVVIATDQDLDGIHLSSMLIGWFKKFAPNLFNEGRICKLQTPLIIIKDAKDQIKEYFFDLDSFKEWEAKNKDTKLKIQYQKGLGSVERSDMQWLMNINGGINGFLYELNADDKAFSEIDLWLTGDSEPRKEKLRKYTLDINMI